MAWNINLLSPATNVLDIALPAKLQPLKQFFFTFYITDAENNLYILKNKNTETVFNFTYRKLNGNLLVGVVNLVKLYSGKNLTLDMTMTSVFFNLHLDHHLLI